MTVSHGCGRGSGDDGTGGYCFPNSALTEGLCREMEMGLRILPLRNLLGGVLCLERIRDISVLCRGYV